MRRFALAVALVACSTAAPSSPSDAVPGADAGVDGVAPDASHALCMDGVSTDGAYPRADYQLKLLRTVPDLSFYGATGPVALHDYFEPCAPRSRLLVVRVAAPWCGTCLWQLKHTSDTKSLDVGSRLAWLDLTVANRDNDPPTVDDLASYRALIDAPEALAIDPSFQFGVIDPVRSPLPLYAFIDTRTMVLRSFLHDPAPDELEFTVRQELALLDDAPLPLAPKAEKFDGLFSRNRWDVLHDMTLPGAPPPDPTNAKADDPGAATLGKDLFFDSRLSPSNTVSCASCHASTKEFQDGVAQSTSGVAPVDRNAPAIALAAHARWQFWDGRADTLWMQALGPLENAKEFGSSRLFVAHAIATHYASAFAAVFGPLPDLTSTARFPAAGKPGDPAWQAMATSDQVAVTDLFVNVGKAIAAYERTLRVKPNRLDAYIAGDLGALSDPEKTGLLTFFTTGCAQCHWGPRLTNDAFHPDRYPTGRQDGQADRGRIDGVPQLLASEFAQPHPTLTSQSKQLGSFKTTTLRGVAGSAPFGHGGTLATLQDAATNYGLAGLPPEDPRAVGETEPWLPKFTQHHADELVPFLQVLTAEIAP